MKSKMRIVLLMAISVFVSCTETEGDSSSEVNNASVELNLQTTSTNYGNQKSAEEWLRKAIGRYFDEDLSSWSSISTKEYDEYKSDMINSQYDHGFELDSLKKKWSYKYQVSDEKVGVGFLIGAQDYTSIIIKTCQPLMSKTEGIYLFKVNLCDTLYDCYESDITVIENNGSYAIDDVKEYYGN